jgi:hypothetical protein
MRVILGLGVLTAAIVGVVYMLHLDLQAILLGLKASPILIFFVLPQR